MTQIPGTKSRAVFLNVSSGDYPHIYYEDGDTGPSIVSLNAGNSPGLWVGGGGLNAAFDQILTAAGQETSDYGRRHIDLIKAVSSSKSSLAEYGENDNPTLYSNVVAQKVGDTPDYTGVSFADIFAKSLRPHGNDSNRGMLYVAPPDGSKYSNTAEFLADITKTALHGVQSVNGYNSFAATKPADTIDAIRLNLFSSGIYKMKGVNVSDIAVAIWKGISTGLQDPACTLTEVQMPVVHGGSPDDYFNAVKKQVTS